MAEVVRELPGIGQSCCLVRHRGQWFRVSTIDVVKYGGGSGIQTLVLPCDEAGRAVAWETVVAGWMGRAEAIALLASQDI